MALSSHPTYYTSLADVVPNTVVNVFGIVKFHKFPFKTSGPDFLKVVSLTDHSLIRNDGKLLCLLFAKQKTALPEVQIGSIVRFHRLRVEIFDGYLQAKSTLGFSWLVCDRYSPNPHTNLPLSSSAATYCLKPDDKARIVSLKKLAKDNEISYWNLLKTLSQLEEDMFFDLLCQVVAVGAIDADNSVLVMAYDGTQSPNPLLVADPGQVRLLSASRQTVPVLMMCVNVFIFGEHCVTARALQAGDLIKLCNLHCYRTSEDVTTDFSTNTELKLILHDGSSWGRGIRVLKDGDDEWHQLQYQLSVPIPKAKPKAGPTPSAQPPAVEQEERDDDVIIVSATFPTPRHTRFVCGDVNWRQVERDRDRHTGATPFQPAPVLSSLPATTTGDTGYMSGQASGDQPYIPAPRPSTSREPPYIPAPRPYPKARKPYTQAPRPYTPALRSYTPALRSYTPLPKPYSPVPGPSGVATNNPVIANPASDSESE